MSLIARHPFAFGEVRWLTEDDLDDEILALLPRGLRTLDTDRLEALQDWFGVSGKFPAVRVRAGDVEP